MSNLLERPRLRPGLAAAPHAAEPSAFILYDQQRVTHRRIVIRRHEIAWAQLFDGRSTLGDVHAKATQPAGGMQVPIEEFANLVRRLDEALLLDSERLFDYFQGPVREPSCIGSYAADPAVLRKQLGELFSECGAPIGSPCTEDRGLRAVLVPHMDYRRGGAVYGHGFKEMFDRCAARTFVIIATSHYSPARFTLSRQHFLTPLGLAETDVEYVKRIADVYGDGAFADPLAHYPEHSIELEVVLLQYLYEKKRDFRIVPLLVGSFADAVQMNGSPGKFQDIARMVAALREAETAANGPVCYVISGDLAHIGPKFNDPDPVHEAQLTVSRAQDQCIMEQAAAANVDGYFEVIAAEGDARRICGLPPTWLTLAATKPSRGRLLKYDQYVERSEGFESVSFASMAFDR